jgi:hypothetical protein
MTLSTTVFFVRSRDALRGDRGVDHFKSRVARARATATNMARSLGNKSSRLAPRTASPLQTCQADRTIFSWTREEVRNRWSERYVNTCERRDVLCTGCSLLQRK